MHVVRLQSYPLISGHRVDFEDIYTEGITEITERDMEYAKQMQMIKPLW